MALLSARSDQASKSQILNELCTSLLQGVSQPIVNTFSGLRSSAWYALAKSPLLTMNMSEQAGLATVVTVPVNAADPVCVGSSGGNLSVGDCSVQTVFIVPPRAVCKG